MMEQLQRHLRSPMACKSPLLRHGQTGLVLHLSSFGAFCGALGIFSYDCVKKAALQHWEDAGSSQPRVGSTSPLTLERLVVKRELLQPCMGWPASWHRGGGLVGGEGAQG